MVPSLLVRLSSPGILCLLAILIAACGSGTTADPTPGAPAPGVITDAAGRQVQVDTVPSRVAVLSPTADAFASAFRVEVAATVEPAYQTGNDVPPGPTLGPADAPDLGTLADLDVDLVLADVRYHAGPPIEEELDELPAPVIFLSAASYESVLKSTDLLGQVFDRQDTADELTAAAEEALGHARETLQSATVVVVIAGEDGELYAANRGSLAGDLLEVTGLENPFHGQPDAGPFAASAYSNAPPELLRSAGPDWILALTPPPGHPAAIELVRGLDELDAVAEGRLGELDGNLFLEAPGPQVGQAFHDLADLLGAPEGDD